MKTLFIEANMGAAGDMLMGSLFELIDDKEKFLKKINSLDIGKIKITNESSEKCGISGTHMKVLIDGIEEHEYNHHYNHYLNEHDDNQHTDHEHEHKHNEHTHCHSDMHSISHIISHLDVSDKVRNDVIAIYKLIAEAESTVHNKSIDMIHFHEVGEKDAIIDITGCCILMEMINADKVICSPIHVGKGSMKCAHGILPVPTPATAFILTGIPYYSKDIDGELCTPTGAAILKHFVDSFENMPLMTIEKIGYGMGTKDFKQANMIRTFLGETNESTNSAISELTCNIDDMTGEALGYAVNIIMKQGALDAFTTPIYMKENRPAVMLTVLCKTSDSEKFAKLILLHTTSFGVRKKECERYTLSRDFSKKKTKYGDITIKSGTGYGVYKSKPEYKSIAKLADENNIPLSEIYKNL